MKRIITMILTIMMCLSLGACDNTAKVENQLNGISWVAMASPDDASYSIVTVYYFEEGKVSARVGIEGLNLPDAEILPLSQSVGTYELTEDKIIFQWQTENDEVYIDSEFTADTELRYSMNGGTLQLYSESQDVELFPLETE